MSRVLSRMGMAFLLLTSAGPLAAEGSAAWLGLVVTYQDEAAIQEGRMTVTTVYPGSPAAQAGLKVGDQISRVNEVAFRFESWTATVAGGGPFVWAKPGDHIRMTILRGAKTEILDVVAASPPAAIVEERRIFQSSLVERRGPEVFDALARRGASLRVQREKAGGSLAVEAEGLSPRDLGAVSHFLSTSRLRTFFARLEPGQSMRVKLDIDPDTGDPRVEGIHP